MNWLRFLHRRRRNADLAREIAEHLEQERSENRARGMSSEEADRTARIKLGSIRRIHEDLLQQNSIAWIEATLRDLKYATRTLARTPGFTLTAILVMALGIGATTALFTVVRSVLLNPLPYRDSSRLIELYEDESKAGFELHYMPASGGGVAEWRKAVGNRRRSPSSIPGRSTTSLATAASCRNRSTDPGAPGISTMCSVWRPRSVVASSLPTTSPPRPPQSSSRMHFGVVASRRTRPFSARPSRSTQSLTPSSASCRRPSRIPRQRPNSGPLLVTTHRLPS